MLTSSRLQSVRQAFRWEYRSALFCGFFCAVTGFVGVIARDDLHASKLAISLLFAAPFLGNLLSIITACHMQHRRKVPYVVWLVGTASSLLFLVPFVYSGTLFVALIVASHIIDSAAGPAYAAVMKVAYPDAYRVRLMGFVRGSITVVMMATSVAVGRLMQQGLPWWWTMLLATGIALVVAWECQNPRWKVIAGGGILALGCLGIPYMSHPVSFRILFPLAAVAGLLCSWAFSHMPDTKMQDSSEPRFNILNRLNSLATDRRFGLFSLAYAIFGFGAMMMNPLVPLLQVDELHITKQWVGIIAMISSGAATLMLMAGGRLLIRFNSVITTIGGMVVMCAVPIIYTCTHGMYVLATAQALSSIASPVVELAGLNAVLSLANHDDVPRYTGVHSLLIGIRGLLAPLACVWLMNTLALRHCFIFAGAVLLVGLMLMLLIARMVLLAPTPHTVQTARAPV